MPNGRPLSRFPHCYKTIILSLNSTYIKIKCGFSSTNPTARCIRFMIVNNTKLADKYLILLCKAVFLLINPEETKPFEDTRNQTTKTLFCFGFQNSHHYFHGEMHVSCEPPPHADSSNHRGL